MMPLLTNSGSFKMKNILSRDWKSKALLLTTTITELIDFYFVGAWKRFFLSHKTSIYWWFESQGNDDGKGFNWKLFTNFKNLGTE